MNIAWAEPGRRAAIGVDEERRHELRAALFGIEASAQGLWRYRTNLTGGQVEQLARALLEEAHRLRTLLDGRPSAVGAFDLAAALGPAVATARAGGHDVRATVPPGIVVEGRRDALVQVVVALVDNARRHAPGSPVDIHASVQRGTATVYVEDRGPGIPRRLRRRVFQRDVRGPASTGSGLGLYIAHRLMAEQGGSIAAHPRRRGGTTFALRLRIADPR